MKNINSTYKNFFIILVTLLLFISCGKKNTTQENIHKETTEEKDTHQASNAVIATLTAEQMKAVNITLGNIEKKELTATIKANGMLRVPNNFKANITALYGGVIKTINVEMGNYVRKGQVIATITIMQLIQLQEEYLNVNNKIILAEQELQRQKDLNEGNAGILKNLQSATTELNILKTRKTSLQQQFQLMGIHTNDIKQGNMLTTLNVVSPINGVISNIFLKIGSYIDIASPVAEVVDNNALHLDLNVFEKDLPLLKVGQIIHFTLTNNPVQEYDAVVYSIGASFENESKTISVHANLKGNKKGLIDGMNVTGIISLDNVTTPAVPNDAIVEADGKYYVFVQTNQVAEEEHHHEDEHNHAEDNHAHEATGMSFEKVEVIKGVSNMGYTSVTFVKEVSASAKIVTKGAFFINAKLSNVTDGHQH